MEPHFASKQSPSPFPLVSEKSCAAIWLEKDKTMS